MIAAIELAVVCLALFAMCYLGTGTDDKNLRNDASYPDAVQNRIKGIPEYCGKRKGKNQYAVFLANFVLFLIVLLILGIPLREKNFWHNFLCLSLIGQGLNLFDLLVIDLLWWRNSKRIRFTKIPEKELYSDPKKHIQAFGRALIMYLLIAGLDGYVLTLL